MIFIRQTSSRNIGKNPGILVEKDRTKKEQKSRIMCYTIIVQSWTFAMGAVYGAEKASQIAPFVVP